MVRSIDSPAAGLNAAIDRLNRNSDNWPPRRVLDEGLDLIRDHCWASSVALYSRTNDIIRLVAHRPELECTKVDIMSPKWFPWGLAPLNPHRFMFIEDARLLPAAPTGGLSLADLGVQSCVHLPVVTHGSPVGYMQVFWPETRLVWNDEIGATFRALAHILLAHAPVSSDVRSDSTTS